MRRTQSRSRQRSRGFTLIEAMVALGVTVMAGSAVLLGITSTLEFTEYAFDEEVAQGVAATLMDEIAGCSYCEPGVSPTQWPLGPGPGESTRDKFNDIDDYHGLSQGIVDRWGIPLGEDNGSGGYRDTNSQLPDNYFDGWTQSVIVYYVSEANPSAALAAGSTSLARSVEVSVTRLHNGKPQELARIKRVFAYVPAM